MGTDTENLVLEHLRPITRRVDGIYETQQEYGRRLTGLEHGLADLKRMLAHDSGNAAEQSGRIDRLAERLARVEQRLELRPD